jgi:hypothetical protein
MVQRFYSMSAGSIVSVIRQNIMAEGCGRAKVGHFMLVRKQRDGERGRSQGQDTLQRQLPRSYSLQ